MCVSATVCPSLDVFPINLHWSQFCVTCFQCYLKLSKPSSILSFVFLCSMFVPCASVQKVKQVVQQFSVLLALCPFFSCLWDRCVFFFLKYNSLYVDSLFYIHSIKKHMGTPSRSTFAHVLVLVLPENTSFVKYLENPHCTGSDKVIFVLYFII